MSATMTCPHCDGFKIVAGKSCPRCRGRGTVPTGHKGRVTYTSPNSGDQTWECDDDCPHGDCRGSGRDG